MLLRVKKLSTTKEQVQMGGGKNPSATDSTSVVVFRVSITRTAEDVLPWNTLMFEIWQNGKKQNEIIQKSEDESFGTASVELKQGVYQVLVLGHSSTGNPSREDATTVTFTKDNGYSDVFYSYGDITVGTVSEEHEIVMQRATSMVRFTTKDTIPEKVKSIRLLYSGGSTSLNVKTGYGFPENKSQNVFFDVADSMRGKPLYVDLFTFKREKVDSLELIVTAYTTPRNAETIKEFKSRTLMVPIKHHEITECSGYFFTDGKDDSGDGGNNNGGDGSGGINASFSIVVDTAWAGTNYYSY